jgi:hypothetical protein
VPGDRAALILVMHHVLTDGVGGLAVLAALGMTVSTSAPSPFRSRRLERGRCSPRPGGTGLPLSEAFRATPRGPGRVTRELGISINRPRLAARISLNQPTGRRRRLTVVQVCLTPLLEEAHRRGCTLNDAVLVAVTGAMVAVLRRRGERPGELVVSVPISVRRTATVDHVGNQTSVVPLAIPSLSDRATFCSTSRRCRAPAVERHGGPPPDRWAPGL